MEENKTDIPVSTAQSTPSPVEQNPVSGVETPVSPTPSQFNPSRKRFILVALIAILVAVALGGGYFLWQNSQKKPETTNSLIPSPTAVPNTQYDSASNGIYKSTKLGFSFNYPEDYFKYQEPNEYGIYLAPSKGNGGNGPKFLEKGEIWLDVSTSSGANLKSIDEFLNLKGQGDLYLNAKKSKFIFDGIAGYKVSNSYPAVAGNVTAYSLEGIVLKDETLYHLVFSSWNQEGLDSKQEMIDQILSTFKFVESSDVKTYTSSNLGVSFSYKYKYNDNDTISVKEIGSKIYAYPSTMKPEDGQYVEVFDKNSGDSLKTAITNTVLKGYSTSDCIVTETTKNPSGGTAPTSYKFARIDVPRTGNEELPELSQKAEKCPSPYAAIGGLTYFLMDQNHSSKFVFFSVGQYAIDSGSNQTWQDTIKFN